MNFGYYRILQGIKLQNKLSLVGIQLPENIRRISTFRAKALRLELNYRHIGNYLTLVSQKFITVDTGLKDSKSSMEVVWAVVMRCGVRNNVCM
jgi:hypothetical protein